MLPQHCCTSLEVAHNATGMALMKNPTKRFCKVIRWVDDAMDEGHDNVSCIFPVLNGKMLDINVSRAFGGDLGVDHVDGRLVVGVEDSRAFGRKTQLCHDSAKVFGMLGGGNSSHEFSFSGACGSDGLCFAAVGHSSAAEHESITCSGTPVAEIVGMGGVKETSKFAGGHGRKVRKGGVMDHASERRGR